MDLNTLINKKKLGLKPCKTVLTDTSGNKYEIENGSTKELSPGLPFVVDTKPDLQIARILPGLFLSSQDPAVCPEILREQKIRHILSIGVDLPVKFHWIQYYKYDLLDLPEEDITNAVKACLPIIHFSRKENILVHCNAGVSRSSTIVIAYLMTLEEIDYETALNRVRSLRNCVKPNNGFSHQLKQENFRRFLLPEIPSVT